MVVAEGGGGTTLAGRREEEVRYGRTGGRRRRDMGGSEGGRTPVHVTIPAPRPGTKKYVKDIQCVTRLIPKNIQLTN